MSQIKKLKIQRTPAAVAPRQRGGSPASQKVSRIELWRNEISEQYPPLTNPPPEDLASAQDMFWYRPVHQCIPLQRKIDRVFLHATVLPCCLEAWFGRGHRSLTVTDPNAQLEAQAQTELEQEALATAYRRHSLLSTALGELKFQAEKRKFVENAVQEHFVKKRAFNCWKRRMESSIANKCSNRQPPSESALRLLASRVNADLLALEEADADDEESQSSIVVMPSLAPTKKSSPPGDDWRSPLSDTTSTSGYTTDSLRDAIFLTDNESSYTLVEPTTTWPPRGGLPDFVAPAMNTLSSLLRRVRAGFAFMAPRREVREQVKQQPAPAPVVDQTSTLSRLLNCTRQTWNWAQRVSSYFERKQRSNPNDVGPNVVHTTQPKIPVSGPESDSVTRGFPGIDKATGRVLDFDEFAKIGLQPHPGPPGEASSPFDWDEFINAECC